MSKTAERAGLAGYSDELAGIVERVSQSVVAVDDGSRLTAGGIVYNSDGLIVATSHGVERDDNLTIETGSGERFEAVLVGRDTDVDIAVLRAEAKSLTPIDRAPSESIRVGSLALAIGRPGGGIHATLGIVSARVETESNGKPAYLLHTDATLYPGFSGGALVDAAGRTTGLLNLMFGRGRGIALGLPVVDESVESILTSGSARRGFLGVRTQLVDLPESIRRLDRVAQDRGLLVVGVEPGSPAETGGIMLGDTLLSIGERRVEDVDSLRSALRSILAGNLAAVTLVRGGALTGIEVILGSAA